MGRTKWKQDQERAVEALFGTGRKYSVRQVYWMLLKRGILRNLTSGNIRSYLDREEKYERVKGSRPVRWRRVAEPGEWLHVQHTAKKYD